MKSCPLIQWRHLLMTESKLKNKIESKLKIYIHRFIRYAGFSHISDERKEIIAGTFAYLIDGNDLIPDDVPNIGYLDDLLVFVEAARHFIASGTPITGVCDPKEVLEDHQFVQKNAGLIFGNQHFSLDTIRNLGKKHVKNLKALSIEIKKKYVDLGEFDNENK